MLEHVPAWLGKALRNARAGHGKLAVARLGGEDTLHREAFVLRSAAGVMVELHWRLKGWNASQLPAMPNAREPLAALACLPRDLEMVDLISESAFSLLDIIEDILDLSKIEAGKLEIERVPITLVDVMEKACGLLDDLVLGSEFVPFLTLPAYEMLK